MTFDPAAIIKRVAELRDESGQSLTPRSARIASTADMLEAASAEVARIRQVVNAALNWREMRYPQARCWKADCTEDMDLVSAVDAYRAQVKP